MVDLSSHSLQSTESSDNPLRQENWPRVGGGTSASSFLLAASGSMTINLLEGQTPISNNGFSEMVGQTRRRRPALNEADLNSALSCPACGKLFAGAKRRYHLERHLITHTGERPFPCPHCPYRANVRENLARHVRHRHPDTLPQPEEMRT
ncbi:hypothetical protein Pmani_018722 [Petrolisthes manimaculis]|uniref:C2H2-type domain-containing protein n=2 Tax=Petrolisthes TaxID=84661 RepID=A0AAE1PLU5_9EUCA|nr:hypothetical protein Pcinc_014516 [Petrolisthes cinctipes]KAK4309610.1 hypothetical protein Pmani_018722 [Petrolisthes manimaculis]